MPDKTFDNFRDLNRMERKTSYRADRRSTIKTVDPDVKGATKAYDDIFGYAKKVAKEFQKDYVRYSAEALKTTVSMTINTYNNMYKSLSNMHKSYINNILNKEIQVIEKINKHRMLGMLQYSSISETPSNVIFDKSGRVLSKVEASTVNLNNIIEDINQSLEQFNDKLSEVIDTTEKKYLERVNVTRNAEILQRAYSYLGKRLDETIQLSQGFKSITRKILEENKQKYEKTIGDIYEKYKEGTLNISQAVKLQDTAAHDFLRASRNIEIASSVFSTLGESLMSYFEIWTRRFTQGIDKIFNEFERTYTTVSVLMIQNQNQYMEWQKATTNELKSLGLSGRISISEVMSNLEQAVLTGLTGQEAQRKALSDAISKTLAPFVDVTSDAYIDLQRRLGNEFVNTMIGMGRALNEQLGQSRVFNRSINQIIEMLHPIMLNAEYQYSRDALGEAVAMLEASGLDTASAARLAIELSEAASNPYQAITGGNIMTALAVANAADPTNLADLVEAYLRANASIYSGVGTNIFARSAIQSVTGAIPHWSYNQEELYQRALSGTNRINTEQAHQDISEAFARGDYITDARAREITMENISLSVAQIRQQMPDFYMTVDQISRNVKAILWALIGGTVFNKFGGAIFGKTVGTVVGSAGNVANTGLISSGLLGKAGAGIKGLVTGSSLGTAATIGGTLAGATLTGYGAYQTVKSARGITDKSLTTTEKSDKMRETIGYGTGAFAGLVGTAAILAGTGPIGWTLLGLGALTIGVTELSKVLKEQSSTIKELNKHYDEQIAIMKEEAKVRTQQVEDTAKQAKNILDIEDRKQFMIQQEIATKEQVQSMTLQGTEQFIKEWQKSAKKLEKARAKEEQNILKEATRQAKEDAEKAYETNKKAIVEAVTEADISVKKNMLRDLGVSEADIEKVISGKKSVEKVLTGGWFSKGILEKLNTEDFKIFLEAYDISGALKPKYTSEEYMALAGKYANAMSVVETYSKMDKLTPKQQKELIEAKEVLEKEFKNGLPSMYASGIPYVPSGRLAYLHEGEAVLTKQQNAQLRAISNVTTLLNSDIIAKLLNTPKPESDDNKKKYTEVTDVITACAKMIVEAINNSSQRNEQTRRVDYNRLLLENSTMRNAQIRTSDYDSIVNLIPTLEGSR